MKIEKKYLEIGTGTKELNARDVPANFTPTNYAPSQVASEGTDKISAHLKGLDTKVGGFLAPSSGDISETPFTGAESASGANITGLVFATGSVRSFDAMVSVFIDATADLVADYRLRGVNKSGTWELTVGDVTGDAGINDISFDINPSTGQVIYSSLTYAGFSSMPIRFRAISTGI